MGGREEIIAFLHGAATARVFSGEWACHHLRHPPKGLDPKLLTKLYVRLISERQQHATDVFRHLVDEHVQFVTPILDPPGTLEATFVGAFIRNSKRPGPAIREAGAALHALRMFDWAPGKRIGARRAVAKLIGDPRVVSGSQEVVARYGTEDVRHVAILAAEGSAESADIMIPLASLALKARDHHLEELVDWLVPFAQSSHMREFVAPLVTADEPRNVRRFLRELGATGPNPHLRCEMSSKDGHARLVMQLQTASMPSELLELSFERNGVKQTFTWGAAEGARNKLKLTSPRTLERVPAWLQDAATKLGVRWDPASLILLGSLSDGAFEEARRWLLSQSGRRGHK